MDYVIILCYNDYVGVNIVVYRAYYQFFSCIINIIFAFKEYLSIS